MREVDECSALRRLPGFVDLSGRGMDRPIAPADGVTSTEEESGMAEYDKCLPGESHGPVPGTILRAKER